MHKKRIIDLKIVAILFAITTMLATCISLSKYKSTFATPNSSAIIGKPIIEIDSNENITLESMKPGTTREYTFSVKNQQSEETTEVVMAYTLIIETQNYLPLTIELYNINNGIVETNNLLNNANFTNEREFNMLSERHDYKLVVKWSELENDYNYSKEIDCIKIKLNSYQKNNEENNEN